MTPTRIRLFRRWFLACALHAVMAARAGGDTPFSGGGLSAPQPLGERLRGHREACAVLAATPIEVRLCDTADVPYDQVLALLALPDALSTLQEAYARARPSGAAPEFEVRPLLDVPNAYFYVNRAKERTEVFEIVRGRDGEGRVELVYFARGERFFGKFSAIIAIGIAPETPGRSHYEVSIFARPESATVRFFARHLRLVKLFFRNKTDELNRIFVAVVREASQPGRETAPAGPT